jgi:hypothetical protein
MSWRKHFTDNAGDTLRFIAYAFLAFDLIVLSIFSLWFVGKFIYFLSDWLNRVMFGSPW